MAPFSRGLNNYTSLLECCGERLKTFRWKGNRKKVVFFSQETTALQISDDFPNGPPQLLIGFASYVPCQRLNDAAATLREL